MAPSEMGESRLEVGEAGPREIFIRAGNMQFAAQAWGETGQHPVLALHGWLDNCSSFAVLAPLLKGVHLVAVDMAGHGHSGHRPGNQPYNIWEDVGEVFAIAEQLGWDRFTLLGHSRGAIVSMLAAGTLPQRIENLVLIDGLWPEPVSAEQAPEQLARAILDVKDLQRKEPPVFASVETAVKARFRGRNRLTREAAQLLVERGISPVSGGYTWSTDPRLLGASAFKLTQEHIQAFVNRIEANTTLILAKEGLSKMFEQYQENLALFPHVNVKILPGGHHLHMEAEAERVADIFHEACGL